MWSGLSRRGRAPGEEYVPATDTWGSDAHRATIWPGLFIGNHLHRVTGEIQPAGIQGAHLASDSPDAFELGDR